MTHTLSRARTRALAEAELRRSASLCARWIRAAVGNDATVRIALPDSRHGLSVIASDGLSDGSGRLRSLRRRSVHRTGRPVHVRVGGTGQAALAILPIADARGPLGVVEILAPPDSLITHGVVVQALVEQTALVVSNVHARAEAEHALDARDATLRLASDLLGVRSATEAVRLAVDGSWRFLGTPVVGLLPDRDGWGWFLAGAGGLGGRNRSALKAAIRGLPEPIGARRLPVPSVRKRFREVVRAKRVVTLRAADALLLLGDPPVGYDEFLERTRTLLEATLSSERVARLRRGAADPITRLGIAWTAHELKAPLVGARAALERMDELGDRSDSRVLLRRTRDELQHLADMIDPLLRWSMGTQRLEREQVDLVHIVRGVLASSQSGDGRLLFEGPDRLSVRADARQLGAAIANVVRNALAYSPPKAPVRVRVELAHRIARVVVRDAGPGIGPDERERIFDPFARGREGSRRSSGSGLGLFIARRVFEAHGGSVSLRPSRAGAVFTLELPAMDERRDRSAS